MPAGIKDHGPVEITGLHGLQVLGDGCLVDIAVEPPPPAIHTTIDFRVFKVALYLIK